MLATAPLTILLSPLLGAEDESPDETGSLVSSIDDLLSEVSGWRDSLEDILRSILFQPARFLVQELVDVLVVVLTTTPAIYPNPAVEEIHRLTLVVAFAVAGIGFMIAGILYMIGPILGISYAEVRVILPRLVAGLVLATISLPLMQLIVDFMDALVVAFRPDQLSVSIGQYFGITTGLVLVWVTKSAFLLAVVVLFIMRAVYILFVAAIFPLLTIMWALPRVRRYADTFIAGWFAALLMAPLNVLVLRFSFALLEGQGATGYQSLSNWMLGVAALVLLLLVPYQLWTASQSAVGMARSAVAAVNSRRQTRKQEARRKQREQRRKRRYQRRNRRQRSRGGRR